MKPFVARYTDTDKRKMLLEAGLYCEEFLKLNNIQPFNSVIASGFPSAAPWRMAPSLTGLYISTSRGIWVNLPSCQLPGRGFSWTGYKSDRTPAGVMAHEVGHHIGAMLNVDYRKYSAAVKGEPPVTSYHPRLAEDFAEAMRLFQLNPSLLRHGRPKRYKALRALGLVPPHNYSWKWVLRHATPRFKEWAEKWTR